MASAIRFSSRLLLRSAQRSRAATGSFGASAASGRIIPSYTTARGFSGTAVNNEVIKKYSADHEWVSLDTDTGIATIGISEHAQAALGEIVYVELPEQESPVTAGDSAGAVESVKSASDIMSPLSGTVTERNAALNDKPGQINKGAETDGWLFKVQVGETVQEELKELMDEAAYKTHTESSE